MIVALLVIGVVVKRFVGEPLNARDLLVPPVVLLAIGVSNATWGVWTAVGCVVGLLFGALRGLTPRLFVKRGHLWQRYTLWTVLVWIVSAAANFGIGLVSGMPEQARPITLSIGVSLLGEALTLGLRALATGSPFAPERSFGTAAGTTSAVPESLVDAARTVVRRWARD
ncbi:hypothetical protein ACQP25_27345 [Microtetraspora malaysiensis]|uniref:hypothetical protein n=1 Tax=Microtetraspora malaysiensis TaxID=161358 RepID=UPI003D91952F